ncbi:AcnD-accessory protein PrpF [Ceratobasidium sp. AG-Ba]|nr:AcnD-accessory protein PrpF [Ceratobasidium sp. AG-Ba]
MQRFLSAHFCRGGTSKGLFFQDHAFAKVSQETRNKIILAAMGSPDPDGRQIDGMGGGISSLSKAAILHAPGADHPGPDSANAFPGVRWANDLTKSRDEKNGWDVVYRFCQVGVREPELDWGSTCGNLVSAAAMTAINWNLVPTESVLHSMANEESTTLPVRILAANNGLIVTAKVPVMLSPSRTVVPITGGDAVISGVPGTGAPIVIETPILQAPLRTKHSRETLSIDGNEAS